MPYSVTCQCGRVLAVAASQAGSSTECRCGRQLDIPRLSELRSAAGETPIPLNTVERIRAMIRQGELPVGDVCPYSGRPANETVYFDVQCERTWVRRRGPKFFFGWIGLLMALYHDGPREEFGRETTIRVPLRIAGEARGQILRMRSQSKLKRLLLQTPIYGELLREYPQASVSPVGE